MTTIPEKQTQPTQPMVLESKALEPKKKVPLRCKLGFHKWTTKIYHEEKGSFVEHSIKECKLCGKQVKGTRKFDWDKSK